MSKFKLFIAALVVGGVGGLLASGLILPFLAKKNILGTATILSILSGQQVVTKVEERTVIVPKTDYFSEAIQKVGASVVAIQSFKGGRLIRSGSGVVLTQDGLIATVNSAAPAEAEVIQVTNTGRIYRGKVVQRDFNRNIAIVSVADGNLQVARFKTDLPELAKNLIVLSKVIEFGADEPVITPVIVSQVSIDKKTYRVSIAFDSTLFGAALVDGEGTVLGLVDFKSQKVSIIHAETLNSALSSYLAKIKR